MQHYRQVTLSEKASKGPRTGARAYIISPMKPISTGHFFFDSTMKATMLASPTDMPAPATLAMAPADKEGRAIRCDGTNHTAEIEDHC